MSNNLSYRAKGLKIDIIDAIHTAIIALRFTKVDFNQITFIGGIRVGLNYSEVGQHWNSVNALSQNGSDDSGQWEAIYTFSTSGRPGYQYVELADLPVETLLNIHSELEAQVPHIRYLLGNVPQVVSMAYKVIDNSDEEGIDDAE